MSYTFDTDFSAAGNTNYIVAEGHGFCIHHSAGTTINMAPTFLRAGTSAHYGIQDGHVRQFLDDRFNAWAAGDAWANNHLIHIECVNESAGGDWPVSEHTVDTLVEFLANKCRELNYPRLDVGETLFGHKDFFNTYCPGQLYDRLGEIAARVNAMLGSGEWQPAPLPDVPVTQDVPPIKYRVYSERQGWLSEMHNRYDTGGSGDNYGGDGSPILYLAMDFPGWYRVCTERQGWLDPVTQYNVDDLENGCAGDGSPITMVECYYETPDPDATGYVRIRYAVANVGCGFFAEMEDTIPDEYGDTHAGNGGRISAFYAYPLKV